MKTTSATLHSRCALGILALLMTSGTAPGYQPNPDNPPVTSCDCPGYVSITPDGPLTEEGHVKMTFGTDGTAAIAVTSTFNISNPPTPILVLREESGREIETANAASHIFTFTRNDVEFPLIVEVFVACANHGSDNRKLCYTKTFDLPCDSCGSGGESCQSGMGDVSGGVSPGSATPFRFEVPIGSNSHGEQSTGIHFQAHPDTALTLASFLIHSNGGYTTTGNADNSDGKTINTGTTKTVITTGNIVLGELSLNEEGVIITIKNPANTPTYRTYQFLSNTEQKRITLYESRCDSSDTLIHEWKLDGGVYSFSEANGARVTKKKILSTVNSIRTEEHEVTEGNETVSLERIEYTQYPWGERMTKRIIDPVVVSGQVNANLESSWTYGIASQGSKYGRLMGHIRHDGHTEQHSYGNNYHQVDYSGGRKVKTTWNKTENSQTVEEYLNTQLISKVTTIRSEKNSGPRTITTRRYIDTNIFQDTTTTYDSTGSAKPRFGGLMTQIIHPDGTATTHAYSTVMENGIQLKKVTKKHGAYENASIIDGTNTETIYNPQGLLIEEITKSIPYPAGQIPEITLAHRKANAVDTHGRPTTMVYFPDTNSSYTETRTFTCCQLSSETDRYGITTFHAYDDLKRRIKSNRLGVTTETHYLGLTTETHRYPETVQSTLSPALSGDTTTLIAKTVRNLAGTETSSYSPDPTSQQAGALVESTSETLYAPIETLSRTVTTIVTGGSQTEEYFLDGRLHRSYGALSPAMEYSYTANATGAQTSQSYVDDGTLRETTTTQYDLLGRINTVTKGSIVHQYDYFGAVGTGTPPVPVGSGYKLRSITDSDQVTTLYAYNAKGERTITAIDLNANGVINYGTDQITRTVTFPAQRGENSEIPVIRTETHVWQDATAEAQDGIITLVSSTDRTPDGLQSWSWQAGSGTTHTGTALGGGGGWTITQTNPDNTKSVQTYAHGKHASTSSLAANSTTIFSIAYDYDAHNRLLSSTDSRTGTTWYAPLIDDDDDESTPMVRSTLADVTPGDLVRYIEDPGERITRYEYDQRGRQITTTLPDTSHTHTAYTPSGEVEARWGSQTYPEFRTYDYAGRLKTLRTKPNLDQNGVPLNTGGSLTTWNYYTDTGLLASKRDHEEMGADYYYTPAGRLEHRDWARVDSTDQRVRTTYGYDYGGRLKTTTYTNDPANTPDVTIELDALGRRKSVSNGIATSGFVYKDDAINIDSETLSYSIAGGVLTRVIHRGPMVIGGRPIGYLVSSPFSQTGSDTGVQYGYHVETGRLQQINNATGTFNYGYVDDSHHLVATVSGPAHTVTNSWEATRNVLAIKENQAGTIVRSSYDYSVVNGGINSIGQRMGVRTTFNLGGAHTSNPGDSSWGYDALGQLTSSDHNTVNDLDRAYQYDAIGNRLFAENGANQIPLIPGDNTTTYTPDPLNQYDSVGEFTPIHDDDGNLRFDGGVNRHNEAREYLWDAENRLVQVKRVADGATLVTYAYDAQSRLIARIDGGKPTLYLYDGWNRIAEYEQETSGHTLVKTYTWGMDLTGSMQGAGGVGGLLAVTLHEMNADQPPVEVVTTYYPTFDGNGNITEYLASDGTVAAHYEYDPFGNIVKESYGLGIDASSFTYKFSTKPLDSITGWYYYGYRYFDPLTGRWPSRDPIEEEGGINLYGFVGNDGVNAIDLLGLALYAFDGTWQNRESRRVQRNPEKETNVGILVGIYDGNVHYERGVGANWYSRHLGGATGLGGRSRLKSAFKQFEEWYEDGDCDIDIIGFSRGAAMAREFANMITEKYPDAKIRFLGLFDTVGSFGAPGTQRNPGYNLSIPDSVQMAVQATANGEKRRFFPLSSIEEDPDNPGSNPRRLERGFPGAHTDVGGGYTNSDLSNAPLVWMHQRAVARKVPFGSLPEGRTEVNNAHENDERNFIERWRNKPRNIFYPNAR